ncbi:hypothetical protein [Nocardia stercoris]
MLEITRITWWFSLPGQREKSEHTATGVDGLPGDPAACVGGEEGDHVGDVGGLAERDPGDDSRSLLGS